MNSFFLTSWYLLAQVAAPASEAAGGGGEAAQDVAKEPGLFDGLSIFLPAMLVIMVLYILLMGKPQAKDARKNAEQLADLKKNDRVVTAGGIMGTVVNVRQDVDHVTLRVDDATGTRMQVLKQSIVRVIEDEK